MCFIHIYSKTKMADTSTPMDVEEPSQEEGRQFKYKPQKEGEDKSKYPQSCLHLLPEEVLQELYAYITSPPFPGNWLYADI